MASTANQRIVKLVQELLLDEGDRSSVTPSLIEEKIELVLTLNPKWRDGLDRQEAIVQLIRRFSPLIGQKVKPQDNDGHRTDG